MVLLEAKIIGVQKSNILLSSNVFNATSQPIPFKSPIEMPNLILLFSSMIICTFVLNFEYPKLLKLNDTCSLELLKR